MAQKLTADGILQKLQSNSARLQSLGVNRIGLFGSYRHNQAHPGSDIDFLVDFKQVGFDNYMDLKFLLEDLYQCEVDLVLEGQVKPRLRSKIQSEVVYAQGLPTVS